LSMMSIVENFELGKILNWGHFVHLKSFWGINWICHHNFDVVFEMFLMRCYIYVWIYKSAIDIEGMWELEWFYWQSSPVEQISNTGWCYRTAHFGTYATSAQDHAQCT
jgi:hypothetical protein